MLGNAALQGSLRSGILFGYGIIWQVGAEKTDTCSRKISTLSQRVLKVYTKFMIFAGAAL